MRVALPPLAKQVADSGNDERQQSQGADDADREGHLEIEVVRVDRTTGDGLERERHVLAAVSEQGAMPDRVQCLGGDAGPATRRRVIEAGHRDAHERPRCHERHDRPSGRHHQTANVEPLDELYHEETAREQD